MTIDAKVITKWRCSVCGYVHEGDNAPEQCPVCKAPREKFVKVEGELGLVDAHKLGVAQGSGFEENLRMQFQGECTEVGMYIAMARQADREGYPEVAEALKRIAWEEAHHAAQFAELLGEVLTESTAENLKKLIQGETGANIGKKDIATRAKQQNQDAIHDFVHEACKDEARHANAFNGLLKRYFA